MSAWLDYLDECWQDGYKAYEVNKKLSDAPGISAANAKEAWQAGYRQAKYEYENTPPNE